MVENDRFSLNLLIISGAMILACAMFLAMAMFLVLSGEKQISWEISGPLTLVSIAVLIPGIAMSYVVPYLVYKGSLENAKKSTTENPEDLHQQACQAIQTNTILKFAILEGGIFLCLVAFFIEASWVPLIFSGIGIAIMISRIPWPRNVQSELEAFVADAKRG